MSLSKFGTSSSSGYRTNLSTSTLTTSQILNKVSDTYTRDPTTEDATGVNVGKMWINSETDAIFVCGNVVGNIAKWKEITSSTIANGVLPTVPVAGVLVSNGTEVSSRKLSDGDFNLNTINVDKLSTTVSSGSIPASIVTRTASGSINAEDFIVTGNGVVETNTIRSNTYVDILLDNPTGDEIAIFNVKGKDGETVSTLFSIDENSSVKFPQFSSTNTIMKFNNSTKEMTVGNIVNADIADATITGGKIQNSTVTDDKFYTAISTSQTGSTIVKRDANGSVFGYHLSAVGGGVYSAYYYPRSNETDINLGSSNLNNINVRGNVTLANYGAGYLKANATGVLSIETGSVDGVVESTPNTVVKRDGNAKIKTKGTYFDTNVGNVLSFGTTETNLLTYNNTYNAMGFGKNALATYATSIGTNNLAFGVDTLKSVTSGISNVAIGTNSLSALTIGNANTSIGYNSMPKLTTGINNTACGSQSMMSNTITGSNNTACGAGSIFYVNTGHDNSALGNTSAFNMTSGYNNTSMGADSLKNVSTGSNNIGIGYYGGGNITTTNNNIDIGNNGVVGDSGIIRLGNSTEHNTTFLAGNVVLDNNACLFQKDYLGTHQKLLTSTRNANGRSYFVGDTNASNSKNQYQNYSFGDGGLNSISGATHDNIAFGYHGLYQLTSGIYNVAVGNGALQNTTSGNYSVGVGHQAGLLLTTEENNTLLGYQAGRNLASSNNICIGNCAGSLTTATGGNNIYIGHSGYSAHTNTICIGPTATSHTSCFISGIYNRQVGVTNHPLYCDNLGQIGSLPSSIRYKQNVSDMENVDYFYDLNPKNFTYKSDLTNQKQYGYIAEEVDLINPLFVRHNEDGEPEGLNENTMMMVAMKCIIEQKKELDLLKSQQELNIKTAPRLSDSMAESLCPNTGNYLMYESELTGELKIAFRKTNGPTSYSI